MRMRRRKSPKPKRLLVLHVKRNLGKPLKNANLYKYSKGRWSSIHIYYFFLSFVKKIYYFFFQISFSWKRNLHNLFEWILLHLNHHFCRQFFSKVKNLQFLDNFGVIWWSYVFKKHKHWNIFRFYIYSSYHIFLVVVFLCLFSHLGVKSHRRKRPNCQQQQEWTVKLIQLLILLTLMRLMILGYLFLKLLILPMRAVPLVTPARWLLRKSLEGEICFLNVVLLFLLFTNSC